jgi:hypothetical protein
VACLYFLVELLDDHVVVEWLERDTDGMRCLFHDSDCRPGASGHVWVAGNENGPGGGPGPLSFRARF